MDSDLSWILSLTILLLPAHFFFCSAFYPEVVVKLSGSGRLGKWSYFLPLYLCIGIFLALAIHPLLHWVSDNRDLWGDGETDMSLRMILTLMLVLYGAGFFIWLGTELAELKHEHNRSKELD